jgi:disulfide bond formation protein DsbB
VTVLAIGLLLLMVRDRHAGPEPRILRGVERWAGIAFLVVVSANAVQAFASTGPPPFMGQSDPIRFSFNPKHWHWSLEEWKPVTMSLRGRWDVDAPDLATLPTDPAGGPFANLPALAVTERRPLGVTLDAPPTDLAYDAASDRFLVTTARGVYLVDGALSRVSRHAIIDPGYSVDIGTFAGAAFLDDGALIAVGHNKSYVVLRPSDTASADANYRYFLASRDQFEETSRGRFGTVRARLLYVQSAAYDPATNSVYTVTVPNQRVKRLVLSRFDRRDLTLSEEFVPELSDSPALSLLPERSTEEFVITGAALAGRQLYLLSAAWGTLLTVDLDRRQVVAAHTIAGLARPTGLAIKADSLMVVDAAGTITILSRPANP